jgi:hypothetical protein
MRCAVVVVVLLFVVPAHADNNPFSGARSIKVSMRHVHHPKWCVRHWNYDYDQNVPIRCEDK